MKKIIALLLALTLVLTMVGCGGKKEYLAGTVSDTGVVAIGVTLLRIVDPEAKSGTLNDYGYSYTLQSVIEVFIIALTPILAVSMGCLAVGAIETGIALVLFLIGAKIFGVHKEKMNELRQGEAEIISTLHE